MKKSYERLMINLDEEMMRLRSIQRALRISEKTVEEAFRIFIYGCGLKLTNFQIQHVLMPSAVHNAAKISADPISLTQISKAFGVPKEKIFRLSQSILVRLISEAESLTIEKKDDAIGTFEQCQNTNNICQIFGKALNQSIR